LMARTSFVFAVVTLTLITLLSGCAAPAQRINITVGSDGIIHVDGDRIRLSRLAAEMRSRGATPATIIEVEIPDAVSGDLLQGVSQPLATAGYKRTIFKKPRRAESETESAGRRR